MPEKSARENKDSNLKSVVTLFGVASELNRLKILLFLIDGERYVTEIIEHLGMIQPAVSHHLSLLRHTGCTETERRGKKNFYSLTEKGRKLAEAAKGVC